MPKQVKQGDKSVYVENNYGKIIVNKFFKLRYLSIALFFIAIVVIAFWQKDQIKMWLGMDRIFSEESTDFKILILPFNKTCSYAGKEYDIGYVIKQRIDSISGKNDLAIESYYLSTFDSKNIDDSWAEQQLFYHYSDIVVFGNYETCSVQEEVCLKYITSLTDTTGNKYGEIQDLKKGYLQNKIESVAAYFSFLGKVKNFQTEQFDEFIKNYNEFGDIDGGAVYALLSQKLVRMKDYQNAVNAYLYGCQKLHATANDTTDSTPILLDNLNNIYQLVHSDTTFRKAIQAKHDKFLMLYEESKKKMYNKQHTWELTFLELNNVMLSSKDEAKNVILLKDMIDLIEELPYQIEKAEPLTYLYSVLAFHKYIHAKLIGVVIPLYQIISYSETALNYSQKLDLSNVSQEVYDMLNQNVVLLYELYSIGLRQPFNERLLLYAISVLENTKNTPTMDKKLIFQQDELDIKEMRLNLYHQAFRVCHKKKQTEQSFWYSSKGFNLSYEYFSNNPKDLEVAAARMTQFFDASLATATEASKNYKEIAEYLNYIAQNEDKLTDEEIEKIFNKVLSKMGLTIKDIDEEKLTEILDEQTTKYKKINKEFEDIAKKFTNSKLNHFTDTEWQALDDILHNEPYNVPNNYSIREYFLGLKLKSK